MPNTNELAAAEQISKSYPACESPIATFARGILTKLGAKLLSVDTSSRLTLGTAGIILHTGTGTPEAAVTAPVGSLFLRSDGGASTTLYVKQTGTGNTGWTAK